MTKQLIVVHGRAVKPAEAKMRQYVERALVTGLRKNGNGSVADQIEANTVKLSFVYYGDLNNEAQYERDKDILIAEDPDHGNGPALPHEWIERAMETTLEKYPKFNKATYNKVLKDADDTRLFDEAASAISFFGAIATFGFLNEKVIEIAKPDMGKYLMSQKFGSKVRYRLHKVLEPYMMAGDDIMLITHSMGCMVAYDVLWKFSHRSEFRHIYDKNNPISRWATIGCPLAEPGVRKNLLDGHLHSQDDKYPRDMVRQWANFYAEDDYISHKSRMKKAFGKHRKTMGIERIRDKPVYNCWVYHDNDDDHLISNPHDLYGYLMERNLSNEVADWARA